MIENTHKSLQYRISNEIKQYEKKRSIFYLMPYSKDIICVFSTVNISFGSRSQKHKTANTEREKMTKDRDETKSLMN